MYWDVGVESTVNVSRKEFKVATSIRANTCCKYEAFTASVCCCISHMDALTNLPNSLLRSWQNNLCKKSGVKFRTFAFPHAAPIEVIPELRCMCLLVLTPLQQEMFKIFSDISHIRINLKSNSLQRLFMALLIIIIELL